MSFPATELPDRFIKGHVNRGGTSCGKPMSRVLLLLAVNAIQRIVPPLNSERTAIR